MQSGENKYRGYTVTIGQETDLDMNPRTEDDNVGKMICFHSRYTLGDEHNHSNPTQFLSHLLGQLAEDTIRDCLKQIDGWTEDDLETIEADPGGFLGMAFVYDESPETVNILLTAIEKHYVILPLHLYDHSGITMNVSGFSCPWDSGQVGWIYCTMVQVIDEWNGERQKAVDYLKGEVTIYDQYLTGDIWYFNIENPDGEDVHNCGGFFGFDYTEKECIGIVDRDFPDWKSARIEEMQERKAERRMKKREEFLSQFINPFAAAIPY